MVQLFQNLLSNALKFHGEAPPRVFVTSEREGHFWRIDVRDEGVGFNPRYADRIFKLFRRLQRGTPGTGIGLSICKKIVERHGGSIGATSEKGAGSTFHFLLPIPPEPEPSP
jgi:signal transduction histidine kinase